MMFVSINEHLLIRKDKKPDPRWEALVSVDIDIRSLIERGLEQP